MELFKITHNPSYNTSNDQWIITDGGNRKTFVRSVIFRVPTVTDFVLSVKDQIIGVVRARGFLKIEDHVAIITEKKNV